MVDIGNYASASSDELSDDDMLVKPRRNPDMHGGADERSIEERLLRELTELSKDGKLATSEQIDRAFNGRRLELIDDIVVRSCRSMDRVRRSLLQQNKLLVDVPSDGSCGIWSVMPAFSKALGRPTTKEEVRRLVIGELRAPEFRADLECDRRNGHEESVEELLANLAEPDAFVPPILLMRATEKFTGGRVRLWMQENQDGKTIPFCWSDGDDIPFCCEIVHVPFRGAEHASGHIARVLSLPPNFVKPQTKRPLPFTARPDDGKSAVALQRALARLEHDCQLAKRVRTENTSAGL